MSLSSEILNQSKGAEFHRADLHIHSYGDGGSYDVHDKQMTVENIIDSAIREKLRVIAITDHNAIGNVKRALDYAAGKDVLVVPGVELSTPNGHLLVYCPTLRALETFVGKLTISADRRSCSNTLEQCLNMACDHEGIGIAAHIDVDAGFEAAMVKYDVHKENVLKCANLMALEIKHKESDHWFTDRDDNPDRKRMLKIRCLHHDHEDGYELPKVMNSDAHTLDALGRNASGNRKLTRFKMDSLSFRALKIALLDPASRVRIEDLIPETVPHFVGMHLEGGFLDGQIVQFSKNLSCIIGGRGAGKSTMLESLRIASGNAARPNIVDSEVWPDRISLIYRDEAGREQILSRSKASNVLNLTNLEDGITHIPIESYGQGETAETIQHCDKNPNILLSFLDTFIDLDYQQERDREICGLLLDNQTLLERLLFDVATIPDVERFKKDAEERLKALKDKDATQVVELEEKLAKEKAFRTGLHEQLNSLFASVTEGLEDNPLMDLVLGLDGSSIVVGQDEFEKLKQVIEEYAAKIDGIAQEIKEESRRVGLTIREQLHSWIKKESETQVRIEEIRKELEAKGIRLNMGYGNDS